MAKPQQKDADEQKGPTPSARYRVHTLHGQPFRRAGVLFTSVPRLVVVGEHVDAEGMEEILRSARRPGKSGNVLFVEKLSDSAYESLKAERAAAAAVEAPPPAPPRKLRDIGFTLADVESMTRAERETIADELGLEVSQRADDEQLMEAIASRA